MNLDDPQLVSSFDQLPFWSASFARMLLAEVDPAHPRRVLDVGCGTGFLSIEFAQRFGCRVDAVDIWSGALARLRGKLDYLSLDRVVVHEVDAVELPFADGTFDTIISNVGLNNFDRKEDVARECARVAAPGALLLLSTNLVGHMAEFYAVFERVLREFGLTDSLERLDVHVNHRATRESVEELLTPAGFALERWTMDEKKISYRDGAALFDHTLIQIGFLDAWKEVVDPEHRDAVFASIAESINEPIHLTIPMACAAARRV